MDRTRELLEQVRGGAVSVEDALAELNRAGVADLGYARVDLQRRARQGVSEVIYGAGKTPAQIAGIVCWSMRRKAYFSSSPSASRAGDCSQDWSRVVVVL